MDPVRNPFAPGAGCRPPLLAGRDAILSAASLSLQRLLLGRSAQSQMLLGLRGVGKTVLLNAIEDMAESHAYLTSYLEVLEDRSLADLLYPRLNHLLRKLALVPSADTATQAALRALRSFGQVFVRDRADIDLTAEPEPGLADSGELAYDMSELFGKTGEALKAAGRGLALMVDEAQLLSAEEFSALVVAMQRVHQKGLPILLFGAGLPAIPALSGEARSCAERLLAVTQLEALSPDDAATAIRRPIEDEGQRIDDHPLSIIVRLTRGHPYFLQEWGFQVWNAAERSPVPTEAIWQASQDALRRLDEGFFQARADRLPPKEKEYLVAMAQLGSGPHRSSDIAAALGEKLSALSPRRAQLLAKGMIYSPSHGDIAFTAPMFDEYVKRHWMGR